MSRQIKFRFAPVEDQQWTVWQKRLALAVILSFFLAPRNKDKRSRLRTAFYVDLFSRAANEEMPTAVQTFLMRRTMFRTSDLLRLSRFEDYLDRLRIQDGLLRDRSTRYISDIATVGLIVKVLASEEVLASEHGRQTRRKVTKARDYILEKYRTGCIIQSNEQYLKDTWTKWNPVAHLCAALVDFLQQRPKLQLDRNDWQRLEDDVAGFLATAHYYQRFLLRELVIEGVPLALQTAKEIDLRQIPSLSLGSPFVTPSLPEWDKKNVPRSRGSVLGG